MCAFPRNPPTRQAPSPPREQTPMDTVLRNALKGIIWNGGQSHDVNLSDVNTETKIRRRQREDLSERYRETEAER